MQVTEFIVKWRKVALTERSAAQQHFLDLCAVFDHPTPAAADPTGDWFTFERGAAKHGGGDHFGLDRVTLYWGHLDFRSSAEFTGDPSYTRRGPVDCPEASFAGHRLGRR